MAQGIPARPAQQSEAAPAPRTEPEQAPWDETMPPPPSEEDAPPLETEPEAPLASSGAAAVPVTQPPAAPQMQAQPVTAPAAETAPASEWPKLVEAMHGVVRMPAYSFLKNPADTVGIRQGNVLTIYFKEEFSYDQVNKPDVLKAIAEVVSAQVGGPVQVELRREMCIRDRDCSEAQIMPLSKVLEWMMELTESLMSAVSSMMTGVLPAPTRCV